MSRKVLLFIFAQMVMLLSTSSYAASYTMYGKCTLQFFENSDAVVLLNLQSVTTMRISQGRVIATVGERIESIKLESLEEVKQLFSDYATCLNDGEKVKFK